VKADPNHSGAKKKKSAERRKVERQKQKDKRTKQSIGKLAHLVKRHRSNGAVSSNDKNNLFISVGSVRDVLRTALHKVYPGPEGEELCESSLCSIKEGDARFLVCDCKGAKSHALPRVSCEADTQNWRKVMKLSKRALGE
jgi:hypothetical protein